MIEVHPSPTADTRSCDFTKVTREQLLDSSIQHIADVGRALAFFQGLLTEAAVRHDTDKLTDIDGFHADFITGFKEQGWWDRHRVLNRHHLQKADGIPDDVNMIDVLDFIADCVMAGMARTGEVYPLELPAELLERAFQNTVTLLKANVRRVDSRLKNPDLTWKGFLEHRAAVYRACADGYCTSDEAEKAIEEFRLEVIATVGDAP